MLLSFEGIDGSGKSTQARLLQVFFETQQVPCQLFHEPGGDPFAETVRKILLDNKNQVSSIAELFLFASSRSQLVENKIRPLLEKNTVVILDRFIDSTVAYQGYGRGISLPIIRKINSIATQNLLPTLTFYLKIDLQMSLSRRKKEQDRMEKSGNEFFQKVIHGYDRIAMNESKRFIVLDGLLPMDAIHQKIVSILQERLL